MKRNCCVLVLFLLSCPPALLAADANAPEHPVCLCRRLGPVRQRLCQARRPGHDQRRGPNAELRSRGSRRRVVSARVRLGPKLHSLPQRPAVGPALLANGARCDLAGSRVGRIATGVSAAAPRRRLPHRRDLQSVESRHAGRCALRGGEVCLREGRRALQPVLAERHREWSPAARRSKRPKQAMYDEVRKNFDAFLAARQPDQPFCYWFGPTNVHRKWVKGSGKALWGIEPRRSARQIAAVSARCSRSAPRPCRLLRRSAGI